MKNHNRAPFGPPGGVVEAAESPQDAVVRVLAEETGRHLRPGRLLALCWITAGGTDLVDMPGVQMVFDMGIVPADTPLVLQAKEIAEAAWVDPENLRYFMGPLRVARMRAALEARGDGEARVVSAARADLDADARAFAGLRKA